MPIIQFPAFDFDSCASIKVDIVVPESLATPANLFVHSETGVVSSLLILLNIGCNYLPYMVGLRFA